MAEQIQSSEKKRAHALDLASLKLCYALALNDVMTEDDTNLHEDTLSTLAYIQRDILSEAKALVDGQPWPPPITQEVDSEPGSAE